ncbi:MAG: TIGR00730 family Rossman fold protein [Acidobacteriota bacterium]
MAENGKSSRSNSSYNVRDEELSRKIDAILEELEPYPNLDLIRDIFVTGVKLAKEDCNRGDLKVLRTSIKELRYAFRVFSRYRDVPKVSVFGSARSSPTDADFKTALELGRKLAEAGYMVITGAGGGIMAAGHEGAGREKSFGLNISLPFEQSANDTIKGDSKLIEFRYFFTRKLFFVKESLALVFLPGGFGTQDEGFESLTLTQTGRDVPEPIVLLDAPGGSYWKEWYRFIESQLLEQGYISEEDCSLFLITDDVDEACDEIHQFYRVYHSSRYVERGERLVLRLKQSISGETIERLNSEFQDILVSGSIEQREAFPEEENEPQIADLSRLTLLFNRRDFGRLRQLINEINRAS